MTTRGTVGSYRIGADAVWWSLFGPDHRLIRRFRVRSWTKDEVKAYRNGYRDGYIKAKQEWALAHPEVWRVA